MQLDFFKAEVRAFPLAQTVEVQRMARFLSVVHGENAERYYLKRCRELSKRMRSAGLSELEVRCQIADFQTAVQHQLGEMHRKEAQA
ncbi:DUF6074 family protein [Corticibacterium sp. UT-5YL-CI-8]|nr:DUF6074 family protein [Tianweitania sp. UT-5YL-CI-8]